MRTIMVAKQKGGVGATTLARELGVAAAAAGQRVVFLDLDPQGTLRGWWNRRTEGQEGDPNPGLASPPPSELAAALDTLRAGKTDLCIVDTPPSVHPFLGGVMRLADLILLPTRPTTDDRRLGRTGGCAGSGGGIRRPLRLRRHPGPAG
jgi:chromosome partitioning protein